MGQYRLGTVAVMNDSNTVTMTGATVGADGVAIGQQFKIARPNEAVYQVASRLPESGPALTSITLSAPYAGPGGDGLSYQILQGFTPARAYPTIAQGDADWADWLTTSLQMIDADIAHLIAWTGST
jgi:hypothetical protein